LYGFVLGGSNAVVDVTSVSWMRIALRRRWSVWEIIDMVGGKLV
jgi:hypothetical protein